MNSFQAFPLAIAIFTLLSALPCDAAYTALPNIPNNVLPASCVSNGSKILRVLAADTVRDIFL
jgi:hypothetical protein